MGGRLIARVLKRCLRPGAERTAQMAGGVLVFDGVPEGFGVGVWGGGLGWVIDWESAGFRGGVTDTVSSSRRMLGRTSLPEPAPRAVGADIHRHDGDTGETARAESIGRVGALQAS